MWSKRIATVVALATVAAVGAMAPAAWAGGRGDVIFGDLDGDGLTDEAFLGVFEPDSCTVVVQYGRAPGVYSPPSAFTYLKPGGGGTMCPDLGTAMQWDDDPAFELWVAWSNGPPPTLDYNRLVLDNDFHVLATFNSRITPYFLGSADFSGHGRITNYAVGKGGFGSYVINGDVRGAGPEAWCSAELPFYQLKYFNDNRAIDALLVYTKDCADSSNGVVVVLDDGTVRRLQIDTTGRVTWQAKADFANSDNIPDVQTVNPVTGEIDYFIATVDGNFVESPKAVHDTVSLSGTRKTAIDVLANDYVTNQAKVTITTPPRFGTVQVTSSRTVVFTPNTTHGTTDRFVYQVTEGGKKTSATVKIRFRD